MLQHFLDNQQICEEWLALPLYSFSLFSSELSTETAVPNQYYQLVCTIFCGGGGGGGVLEVLYLVKVWFAVFPVAEGTLLRKSIGANILANSPCTAPDCD